MAKSKLHTSKSLIFYSALTDTELELPYIASGVKAGFPSPAMDFMEGSIDMSKHLVKNQAATFYCRVLGDSMKNAGIDDGDMIVVDKSLETEDGKIAVCFLDGEFTLKRLRITKDGDGYLMPENDEYKPILINECNNLIIWGIVTFIIKKTK